MKWWKFYGFILVGLAGISPAHGQTRDGNRLHAMCENSERSLVEHYVLGVLDEARDQERVNDLLLSVVKDKLPERSRQVFGDLISTQKKCVPSSVTIGQLADISCKYLKDHPSERHAMTASSAISEAIRQAYPCPR